MGRIQKAGKNIIFGYISNLVILLVNFIQRTVFIYVLGRTLSGVNGVYTDVLSVLSLTELGIGTALNYSLYKPVAERDLEKIKSYMRFYKKAYLTIAGVIAVLGIAISPFLKFILKTGQSDRERTDAVLLSVPVQHSHQLFCYLQIQSGECRAEKLYPDKHHHPDKACDGRGANLSFAAFQELFILSAGTVCSGAFTKKYL